MKLIIAYVRPSLLPHIEAGLQAEGFHAYSVVDRASGRGQEEAVMMQYRGQPAEPGRRPRARIEIAVEDELADAAVEAILDRAHTGKPGDGRIFMVDLVECIHIRTRRQHRSNAA